MKKSLLLFALFLWIGVQTVMAQSMKVRGKVVDASNEPIPGAAVRVPGTTGGTVTDVDGIFEMELPEGKKQVEIDALGFDKKVVNASENMNVTLNTGGSNVLGEVEVIQPYGPATTKEKFTGAADVITAKQIEKMPVSDVTKAIEGAAPGVQVTNGGGQPGTGASLRVRGTGSINGDASPLIVVDGTPYLGDITSINPMDVASITVLKDATATSMYGSRASNGVIVITTKRGRPGDKPRITVDGKVGIVQRGLPGYKTMKSEKDYYETAWKGFYNQLIASGETPSSARNLASGLSGQGIVDLLGYNSYNIPSYELIDTFGHLNPNATLKYHDDWEKELQRTGFRQDYNLSIAGGSDKTDYYLSAGYLREKGYIKYSDYDRFTTRLNVNTQATSWLRVGTNISGAYGTTNYFNSTGTSSGNPNFIGYTTAPIYPVYYRDTNNNKVIDPYTNDYKYDWGSTTADPESSIANRPSLPNSNILGQMAFNENRIKTLNAIANNYAEVKFLKDFTFRTNLNANYTGLYYTLYNTGLHGQFKEQRGTLTKFDDNYFTYTWNQVLSWSKQLDKHSIGVNVAHENYSYQNKYISGSNTGFPSDEFRDLAVASGTPSSDSKTYDEHLESYIANANYGFDGKYLLNAGIRRDGLSRFYQDSRWGNFWSIGGAWVIKNESFMEHVDWVSNLKLKASYGTQGNNRALYSDGTQRYYAWQGQYDLSRPNGTDPAAIPNTLTNLALHWEAQKQFNAGVEFALFKDRLSGELNVYNRTTSGLYYNIPVPRSTGFPSYFDNAASMYNRGVELNLYATPVQARDFSWNVNLNLTKFKNKITKLAPGVDSFVTGNYMYKAGHSIYDFYLVHSAGVDPKNGDELYSYNDSTGKEVTTNNYALANATGRKYVGTSVPDLAGAITNTFSYKGFELSFLVSFSIGGKYYDGLYQSLMGSSPSIGGSNFHEDIMNSWTPENTSASLPRLEYKNINIAQNSDRFLVDASYINLRNINLRYNFPAKLANKAKLNSLSAYIACDNVWFHSKRQGMNPQQSFSGTSDYVYYPARTLMVGLTVGL